MRGVARRECGSTLRGKQAQYLRTFHLSPRTLLACQSYHSTINYMVPNLNFLT